MVALLIFLAVGTLSLGLIGLHRSECALHAARERNIARARAAHDRHEARARTANARLAAFSAAP